MYIQAMQIRRVSWILGIDVYEYLRSQISITLNIRIVVTFLSEKYV